VLYYCPPAHNNQQGIDRKVVDVLREDQRCEGNNRENPKRCLEKGKIKGLWVALSVNG